MELSPMELQARQAVLSQETEFRRLARHLHDGISQLLAAMAMQLHVAKELPSPEARPYLEQCLAIAEQATEQVREISLDLSPPLLDDVAFPDALRYYLDRRSQRTGLTVNVVASSAWRPVPREVEAVCFRVTQEALVNTIRHASADYVHVEVLQDPEAVYLTIRDNGVGFDPASFDQPALPPRKSGLLAMRQRVELLGGCWSIESAAGQGTSIRVCLPLVGQPIQADD